jgi:hypothetical protein
LTEDLSAAEFERLRSRTVTLYLSAEVLMLLGIGVLSVYVLQLGSLVGPGVEQSFGFAVALMFLMSALVIHLVDRTYRSWPLGRRFRPSDPGAVTELDWVHFLMVCVLVAAGGAIAYVVAGLVS